MKKFMSYNLFKSDLIIEDIKTAVNTIKKKRVEFNAGIVAFKEPGVPYKSFVCSNLNCDGVDQVIVKMTKLNDIVASCAIDTREDIPTFKITLSAKKITLKEVSITRKFLMNLENLLTDETHPKKKKIYKFYLDLVAAAFISQPILQREKIKNLDSFIEDLYD